MDFQPTNRIIRRGNAEALRTSRVAGYRVIGRALGLTVLCIAAFECSQLVFRSANCPYWADASAQIASETETPTVAAGANHRALTT